VCIYVEILGKSTSVVISLQLRKPKSPLKVVSSMFSLAILYQEIAVFYRACLTPLI
jgi:hypothetical protein